MDILKTIKSCKIGFPLILRVYCIIGILLKTFHVLVNSHQPYGVALSPFSGEPDVQRGPVTGNWQGRALLQDSAAGVCHCCIVSFNLNHMPFYLIILSSCCLHNNLYSIDT